MRTSDTKKQTRLTRTEIGKFILIILASSAAALLARYLADRGSVTEAYVLPIYAVILLIGGYMGIRIVSEMLDRIVEPTLGVTRARGVENLFKLVSGLIIISVLFTIFGFNLTGFLVGAGFLGIVLGLAAQQVLGNIFAGISMLASRPFEVGDRVTITASTYGLAESTYAHERQIAGFTGVVQDIGIFFTRVLLDNGIPAIFPNSVVIGALIFSRSKITLRNVKVRMDLDKKIDFRKFKSELLESHKKYDILDAEKSQIEIVDVGATTYQVLIAVWARSEHEEPIQTLMIQEGMRVEKELSGT